MDSPPQQRTPFRHTYTAPFIWTASRTTACLHATPGAQQTASREKTSVEKNRKRNQPPLPPSLNSFFPSSSSQQAKRLPATIWIRTAGPQRPFHGGAESKYSRNRRGKSVLVFQKMKKMNPHKRHNFHSTSDGFFS